MKSIDVVGAVIVRENTILATQRGYGEWEGWWEFPGGKVEENETPKQALEREIKEELSASIRVGDYLCAAEYDYPTFHLNMKCYLCTLVDESFELLEHHAARWLDADHVDEINWLPADIQVVDAIKEQKVI